MRISIHTSIGRPRSCTLIVASATPTSLVNGPTSGFDHKQRLGATTQALIQSSYPQLLDLAASSTLIAIPRAEAYSERRTDGYQEPELILIIGTAHLSPQSASDVQRVIDAVSPDDVVVELCRSRAPLMYTNDTSNEPTNLMALGGGNFLEAFQRTMRLGGQGALILRLLLGGVSSQLADSVGIQTGAEFRAAREAAERVGAEVVLGDRPIEITLRRAWEALSWTNKVQLLRDLVGGLLMTQGSKGGIDSSLMDSLNDDDAVSLLLKYLADRYPEAVSPLIYERDLYLAWSLSRSKAVNGAKCVVGVVGRGHMRGVCYALTHGSGGNIRFRDLAGYRDKAKDRAAMVQRFAVETVLACGAVYAWNAFFN